MSAFQAGRMPRERHKRWTPGPVTIVCRCGWRGATTAEWYHHRAENLYAAAAKAVPVDEAVAAVREVDVAHGGHVVRV